MPEKPIESAGRRGRRVARLLRWAVILLVLGGAALWAVRLSRRPPQVEAVKVERGTVERTLAVVGRLRPNYVNEVLPLVPGRLVELPKKEGDPIAAGDVLARIDDREAAAAVRQAEAALRARRQDLAQARRDLARQQELFRSGLVPRSDLEQSRLAAATREEEVRQAEQQAEEVRARLSQSVLRAPFAGYVLERPVDPGQNVGLQTVLYRIATSDEPWIEADIDEQYLSELRLGLPAVVSPAGGRGQIYPASIAYLARQVDPATGAARVRFRFDRGAPDFPAGLSFDVNVRVARHPGALTVPRAAVAGLGGDPWVLRITETRAGGKAGLQAERRPVRVIDWPAARVVVLSGLQDGDRVAASPKAVPPGTAVRVRDAV